MERYHPRAGLAATVVALPTWLIFVLNGMLGFFPALIFADGGIGSKFHLYLYIKDRFLGGSPDPVWSEAGVMTSQEWILLALALPATIASLYCLRKRPDFGNIARTDLSEAREALEVDHTYTSTAGTGDENTAAIIDSVLSENVGVDSQVVAAALGEMSAIAVASAAEVAASAVSAAESVASADSESLEVESTFIDFNIDTSESEVEEEPEPELELTEIPEIFREPVVEEPSPLDVPTLPDIPAVESSMPGLSDVREMISKATEATVSAAKEVASKTVEQTRKVVDRVRPKTASSVMPVRPAGLPPMAEWDPYEGEWMLLGRPIRIAPEPELEPERPSWTRDELDVAPTPEPEVVLQAVAIGSEPVRRTPVIPEIP